MTAKFTRLTHRIVITTAHSGRELYHLQFSLQKASLETFGYTLVFALRLTSLVSEQTNKKEKNKKNGSFRKRTVCVTTHVKLRPV
jgi:hypothetical protein